MYNINMYYTNLRSCVTVSFSKSGLSARWWWRLQNAEYLCGIQDRNRGNWQYLSEGLHKAASIITKSGVAFFAAKDRKSRDSYQIW